MKCGSRINQNLHRTLKTLKEDTSIRVCKFDKGNGVLIIDSDEYLKEMEKIIMDTSKFQEVKAPQSLADPVIRNENSIKRFLNDKVKGQIDEKNFKFIYPSGSQPGKLYGLAKVHKPNIPFRPVVSMIGTSEYNLAQYLNTIITPHLPKKYMLESTAGFLQKLKEFTFTPTDTLVSYDVVSLFTNVPLIETIHIIADTIYSSKDKPKFQKDVFIRMMKIATSGIFMFEGKYYRQSDGVTMGSPLGPTMANFCLAYYEDKLLKDSEQQGDGPAFYARYVDDICCVFRDGSSHQNFLTKLNEMHPNLRFTVEVGNSSLAFLDTHISLPKEDNESFTSRIFRKSTFTGLMLNFNAQCPMRWKVGLIQCLIHRAFLVSSSWEIFNNEIEFLRNTFSKNGYPVDLFWHYVKKFVDSRQTGISNNKVKEDGVETIFSIPFVGKHSITFGKKIRELFKNNYGINVRIVYTSFKVGNYFSLKCRTPVPLMANVVYKFRCLCDIGNTYVGKTKRHLATRAKEHEIHENSAIKDHILSCSLCRSKFSCSSFHVIDSGRNDLEITIKEALHIKYSKPQLNRQLFNSGSSFVLNIFR